jgi:hypothetical protein
MEATTVITRSDKQFFLGNLGGDRDRQNVFSFTLEIKELKVDCTGDTALLFRCGG